jgi:hypothetical protein
MADVYLIGNGSDDALPLVLTQQTSSRDMLHILFVNL